MSAASRFQGRPPISASSSRRKPTNGARWSGSPTSKWSDRRSPLTQRLQKFDMIGSSQPGVSPMQLVAERSSTDTIRAKMNYIVDSGTPPVRYIDWPEMADKEIPPQYREHEVTIR